MARGDSVYRCDIGVVSQQVRRDPVPAPARATDLSGLPPAYVGSAEFCPNRDEDIDYALRLLQAGVSVELHQWPGTFHGLQAILYAEIFQRQLTELAGAIRRGLAN